LTFLAEIFVYNPMSVLSEGSLYIYIYIHIYIHVYTYIYTILIYVVCDVVIPG